MSVKRRVVGPGWRLLVVTAASLLSVSSAAVAGAAPSVPTTIVNLPAAGGLPPVPAVDPSISAGQDPKVLLARAIALLNAETPIQPLLSAVSSKVTAAKVAASRSQIAAGTADAHAGSTSAAARVEQSNADALQATLRQATLLLYMNGSSISPSQVDLAEADDASDAVVGVQLALSPDGILAAHRRTAAAADADARSARTAQSTARAEAAQAEQAFAAVSAQSAELQTTLATLAPLGAKAIAAEQAVLSDQATQAPLKSSSLPSTAPSVLPPPVATTSIALSWAFSELGRPFAAGTGGPGTFDCAGLAQFAWNKAGIATPATASEQDSWSLPVSLSELRPGDLIFLGTSDIQQEGIYIGGGMMIDASHSGGVVQISPVFFPDLVGFGRTHGPGIPAPPHGPPASSAPASCDVPSSGVALPLPPRYLHGGSVDDGVDYDAPGDTPLYAMGSGTIIGEGISGFGPNCPVLQITAGPLAGRTVYYGHAGPDLVPVGTQVVAGQQISEVGNGIVGISSGPHLEMGFYPPETDAGGAMLAVLNQVTGSNTGS